MASNHLRINGQKEKCCVRVLDEWECTVIKRIKEKVNRIRRKHRHGNKRVGKQVLKDKKHVDYLRSFHGDHVVVPADKASNNIIIVCKKYYVEVIKQELKQDEKSTYQLSEATQEKKSWGPSNIHGTRKHTCTQHNA